MASRVAPLRVHMQISNDAFDQVLDLPVAAPAGPVAIEPDRSRWSGLTGLYISGMWGLLTVSETDDGLVLEMAGQRISSRYRTGRC